MIYRLKRVAVLFLLVFASRSVRADMTIIVQATVIPSGTGGFQYSYGIMNEAGSSSNMFDFVLTGLFLGGDLENVGVAAGWTVISGDGFIDWTSTDQTFDLRPGEILDGLSFTSDLPPGAGEYLATGSDPLTGFANGDFAVGDTAAPAPSAPAVPEPCMAAPVFLLVAIGAMRLRSKRSLVHLGRRELPLQLLDEGGTIAPIPMRQNPGRPGGS